MVYRHLRSSSIVLSLLTLVIAPAAVQAQLVTAPGAGVSPLVRVIELNGTERTFHAYHPAFAGGVRIALGDVTGDGILDIVTAPGPGGGPHVRVWDGVTLNEVGGFFAYDPAFPGGVWVAAGDVDGDGRADIITGAGAGGGPHVRVWSGADFHEIGGFFAYHPAFPGGVTVAAGDVNGDGRADIITGAGPGGGPHVRVWNATNFSEIGGFFAYNPAFAGGVFVAAGDVNNDGRADIITGAGPGGGPHVRVWNATNFSEIGGFFATDPAFPGGVNVAAIDLTGDGRSEVITGLGPGGLPISSIWNGADLGLLGSYFAFDPSLRAGVFVASVGRSSALRFTSASSTSFAGNAAGTFTVTTAGGATIPTLTVTGALPSGVTFTDNGDRTATLAGTPTVSGTFPLTFTANNGSAPPVTQAFTLTVTEAPAITSAASATFTVGVAGSFTVTTTGFPNASIGAAGALPGGVTFTNNGDGTATIAGTPDPGTGGTYPLTLSATNGVGSPATQNFTLAVNQPAAITSVNAATFVVGQAGSFTITTSGVPAVTTITRGGVALPSGVTYVDNGNGTGTLAGPPAAGTGGTYAITFTAANGIGAPAVQSFTLTVNQAPAITSANNVTFTIGQAGSLTVTTTGFPSPSIVRGGAVPTGVGFVDNSNGTGTLSGTPGAGTAGTYPLTFTANNGVGSPAVQNFVLTVACPAINVTPAAGVLAEGTYLQAYSQTFGATGSTGITFNVTAGAIPPGMTLASNGALTGSPGNTGTFTFTVTATDAFACTGSAAYSLTVRPNAVDESYSGGVGNTQMVVAPAPFSSTPAVFVVGTVLSNDAGPGGLTAGPASIASANGGTVALGSTGAFVYTPAIGFAGPSDTFVYTLLDGNGVTDTATVTLNLSGRVWYVNNSGGNGDGRSHSPFNALNNAQAPSLAGDVIFVHAGVGTTPGAITLKASQALWGNGQTFILNSLTIGAAGTPLLGGTVTLANDVLVRAVDISAGASSAIVGTGLTGTETIDSVNVTGGATGFNLTNVGGTFTVVNSSVANVTGTDVRIDGGDGTLSLGVAIANTAGRSVHVDNRSGGSIGFTRPITDTAQGIFLTNNSNGTVLFLGGLTLNTGANAAFTATNGAGRVSADQDNVTVVNTITTTTGTALSVTNYNIGTVGLKFRSISSNGAVNGILLNNTGAGSLTVTGDGGGSNNGSGGTIQNTTGAAVSLTNTVNPSLGYLNISNSLDDGIFGLGVTNFTLNRSNLTNNGNSTSDEGIQFGNPTGTAAGVSGVVVISNVNVSGSAHNNVWVRNGAGTLASFTVSNSSFNDLNDITGANSFLFETTNTATVTTASITGSTFSNNSPQRALDIIAHGDTGTGFSSNIASFTVSGNTFDGNGLHLDLAVDTAASLGFSVLNNSMLNAVPSHAINVFSSSQTTGGTLTGRIQGNTIGNAGVAGSGSTTGNGIRVLVQGQTAATLLLDNNVIRQTPQGRGIDVQFLGPTTPAGAPTSDVTVTNNDVNPQDSTGFPLAAIYIAADSQGGGTVTVRSDVRGNTVPLGVAFDTLPAYLIVDEVVAGAVAELVDTAPASASCTTQLTSTNTGTAAAAAGCALIPGPLNTPPLLAAGTPLLTSPAAAVTTQVVQQFASQAMAWSADTSSVPALVRSISVADLAPGRLGEANLGRIRFDATAAGFGWFVDPTPDDDEEFAVSPVSGELVARPDGPAAGKMDLLTALTHEVRHVLGDDDRDAGAGDVMGATLAAGVRRRPGAR